MEELRRLLEEETKLLEEIDRQLEVSEEIEEVKRRITTLKQYQSRLISAAGVTKEQLQQIQEDRCERLRQLIERYKKVKRTTSTITDEFNLNNKRGEKIGEGTMSLMLTSEISSQDLINREIKLHYTLRGEKIFREIQVSDPRPTEGEKKVHCNEITIKMKKEVKKNINKESYDSDGSMDRSSETSDRSIGMSKRQKKHTDCDHTIDKTATKRRWRDAAGRFIKRKINPVTTAQDTANSKQKKHSTPIRETGESTKSKIIEMKPKAIPLEKLKLPQPSTSKTKTAIQIITIADSPNSEQEFELFT